VRVRELPSSTAREIVRASARGVIEVVYFVCYRCATILSSVPNARRSLAVGDDVTLVSRRRDPGDVIAWVGVRLRSSQSRAKVAEDAHSRRDDDDDDDDDDDAGKRRDVDEEMRTRARAPCSSRVTRCANSA